MAQLRNEHQDEGGEVIADSSLRIKGKTYHIECESTDDTTMAVRMIEYDFRIGLENARKEGRKYYMEFPRSCVLYLRDTPKTPDELEVIVAMPDGSRCRYGIPAVKACRYKKEDLFSRDLQMLLPFYAMRYEKQAGELEKEPGRLRALMEEFGEIRGHLEKKYIGRQAGAVYRPGEADHEDNRIYIPGGKKGEGKDW